MTGDTVLRVSVLSDLSMTRHRARHGSARLERAVDTPFRMLELLDGRTGDSLALRFSYDPHAPRPEERLTIFLRVHVGDPDRREGDGFRGSHVLGEFYAWTRATLAEAEGPLRNREPSLFYVRTSEEVFSGPAEKTIHYAPLPFPKDPPQEDETALLDSLFDSLTSPCLVDILVRPSVPPESLLDDVLSEIRDLDRHASGFSPERSDTGAAEDLARTRDPVAERHRDFYREYFDALCSEALYEFDVRVASENAHEGQVVARSLVRLKTCPETCTVTAVEPGQPNYAPARAALSRFDAVVEAHPLPSGVTCTSELLARLAQSVLPDWEDHVNCLARVSWLSRVMPGAWARRLLSLPTSDGVRLKTIRIESEIYAVSGDDEPSTASVSIGGQVERNRDLAIPLAQLTKHLFVAGVPGFGKTSTILGILVQLWCAHGIPFLVLESAKREYRALLMQNDFLRKDLRIYTPGNDRLSPFAFNPFEVTPGLTVEEHIAALESCFAGAVPMQEGPLPSLLAEAIETTYRQAGFRLSHIATPDTDWPTMKNLVTAARAIMERRGYVGEVKTNVATAIDVRLAPLARRGVGRIFCCPRSTPSMDDLFHYPTILELDHLNNIEHQNLLVLFLLTTVRERLAQQGPSRALRHVIAIEESHNLIGI